MGRKFTIFTDQKSLQFLLDKRFLLDQRDVSMDYQRWLSKLLGYDFEIRYKAGVDNQVADGLSRVRTENGMSTMELFVAFTHASSLEIQNLLEEVDADANIQKMLRELIAGECEKPGFTVKGGRFFLQR